jgi:hypothetical protein
VLIIASCCAVGMIILSVFASMLIGRYEFPAISLTLVENHLQPSLIGSRLHFYVSSTVEYNNYKLVPRTILLGQTTYMRVQVIIELS